MKILQRIIPLLLVLLSPGGIFGQKIEMENISKDDYIIYSVKKGKIVKPKDIVREFEDYDVLFFGEEHDDSIGHRLERLLFELTHRKFGDVATLSLEMFDRDVQYIVDEYLQGKITERYFNKDSRQWKNYADYKPMVEYAKENKLHIICANAPFRYVRIAGRQGQEALMKLFDRAKEAMAPLPYKMASGDYAARLDTLMSHSVSTDSTGTSKAAKPAYDMKPGQSLWDATMAYSVYEYKKARPDAKILHLNGRFHTAEYFGIIQRLAEFDSAIKPLVISLEGSDEHFPNVNFEDYKHLGHYIIFTNPAIAKTY